MEIRSAVPTDAEVVTTIARRAKASWGYPRAWLDAWSGELEITRSYIERHDVAVLEMDGRVVGVVGVEVGAHGPEIGHLWVEPDAQGGGVGRRLVRWALRLAEDRGWRTLRVVSDPGAEPFYVKMGAVPTGRVDAPVAGVERTLPVLSFDVSGLRTRLGD